MSGTSSDGSSSREIDPERKSLLDEALKVGEDFVRLYYKTVEQRPHRVYLLYMDVAVVIWDGNPQVGTAGVQKFFEELPSVTFNMSTMDAHPLSSVAVGAQKSFIINTSGTFRISGGGGSRTFFQNFIVTAEGGKWKVASDIFRSQVSPNQAVL